MKKTFSQTIDMRLDIEGPQSPARFFVSHTSPSNVGITQGVQGDRVRLRLWLCAAAAQTGQPHILAMANGPIVVAIKRTATADTFLAIADSFQFVMSDTGDFWYEDVLDLNTVEMNEIFSGKEEKFTGAMDIELQSPGNVDRMTFQRPITICRQIYQGTEAPPTTAGNPYPPPGDIPSRAELAEVKRDAVAAIAEIKSSALDELSAMKEQADDAAEFIKQTAEEMTALKTETEATVAAQVRLVADLLSGSFEWRNEQTGLWHTVCLVGTAGAEAIQIAPGYPAPSGKVRSAIAFTISAPSVARPKLNTAFTVTAGGNTGWITLGSLFDFAGKGRAAVTKIEEKTLTLKAAFGDFESDLVTGDIATLVAQAGFAESIKGEPGTTPQFTVGTITTGAPGSQVVVTITGTAANPVLNLKIPRGADGAPGSGIINGQVTGIEALGFTGGATIVSLRDPDTGKFSLTVNADNWQTTGDAYVSGRLTANLRVPGMPADAILVTVPDTDGAMRGNVIAIARPNVAAWLGLGDDDKSFAATVATALPASADGLTSVPTAAKTVTGTLGGMTASTLTAGGAFGINGESVIRARNDFGGVVPDTAGTRDAAKGWAYTNQNAAAWDTATSKAGTAAGAHYLETRLTAPSGKLLNLTRIAYEWQCATSNASPAATFYTSAYVSTDAGATFTRLFADKTATLPAGAAQSNFLPNAQDISETVSITGKAIVLRIAVAGGNMAGGHAQFLRNIRLTGIVKSSAVTQDQLEARLKEISDAMAKLVPCADEADAAAKSTAAGNPANILYVW